MRQLFISAVLLTASTSGFAQTTAETIERALTAAPAGARSGATVIQWKDDFTYETLKKGTNRLVCYDRSSDPGHHSGSVERQSFAVQCTSIGNLERVAQNRKFEAMNDAAGKAGLAAAEANGTRVKPEYGSVWLDMNGPDPAHGRTHTTIAVPGATTQSTGLPDNPGKGGAWIMNAGTTTAHIMIPGS